MKGPEEVATALGLTPITIQARLATIGLDPDARAELRNAADAAAAHVEPFLDTLYRRMREFPDTGIHLTSDAMVERLKADQRLYLRELFDAPIDWNYVMHRLWVGVVHHRAGLGPQWFVATYAHYICDHVDAIVASAPDAAAAHERVLALVQSVLFDASLVLDSYSRSSDADLWSRSHHLAAPVDKVPRDAAPRHVPVPDTRASEVLPHLRLTSDSAMQRRSYVGLSGDDITSLHSLRDLVERHTPAVLDDFYRLFSGSAAIAAVVPAESIGYLRHQVASYWLELIDGAFDGPYAASRMRIGVAHERIGIGPEWYIAGLTHQLASFLRALATERTGDFGLVRALVRAVFLDLSFVIDAYMEAHTDRLLRTDGYASQLVAALDSAVAVVDAHGRLVSANRALLSLVGTDPTVLYLMPLDRAVPVREATELVEAVRERGVQRLEGIGHLGARQLRIVAMALPGHPQGDATALLIDDVTDLVGARVGAGGTHS